MSKKTIAIAIKNGDEMREGDVAKIGDQLLAKAGILGRVFFDGSQFFFQDREGNWQKNNRKIVESYLKDNDLAPTCDPKEKMSELERAIKHICVNYRVDYAAPLAGYLRGIYDNNGNRVLVTRSFKIPDTKEGDFPNIQKLIDQQLGPRPGEGIDQRPWFYGWWKHSLECLVHGYEKNLGMCLVLAGARGCGKSLLKRLICQSLGGRECQPYNFLTGKDQFNGEFLRSELWAIDDDFFQSAALSREEIGAKIKKVVADEVWHVRGKHVEAMDLKLYRRLVMCVNDEPEKLLVLPSLSDDLVDKILILHCLPPMDEANPMPMPVKTPQDQDAFKYTLLGELSAFMHWLLNVYEIPDALYGRFGVAHFQHPDIRAVLFDLSPEAVLMDQIERACFSEVTGYWHGTASDLFNALTAESSPLSVRERNGVYKASWLGRQLSRIATQHPERLKQMQDSNGSKEWYIARKDRTLAGITPANFRQHSKEEDGIDDEDL